MYPGARLIIHQLYKSLENYKWNEKARKRFYNRETFGTLNYEIYQYFINEKHLPRCTMKYI